jgi:hypothetical protein
MQAVDMLDELHVALTEVTTTARMLYPQLGRGPLGICGRYVTEGQLPESYCAVAIKVATVKGVAYYAGLFVYEGRLLCDAHEEQFAVINLEQLEQDTLGALTAQLKAKANELEAALQKATAPAA